MFQIGKNNTHKNPLIASIIVYRYLLENLQLKFFCLYLNLTKMNHDLIPNFQKKKITSK